jgi:hypothetical protein
MAQPDQPLPVEARLDQDAPPGDFIPPLARLLLMLARRRLAARKEGNPEERKSEA